MSYDSWVDFFNAVSEQIAETCNTVSGVFVDTSELVESMRQLLHMTQAYMGISGVMLAVSIILLVVMIAKMKRIEQKIDLLRKKND